MVEEIEYYTKENSISFSTKIKILIALISIILILYISFLYYDYSKGFFIIKSESYSISLQSGWNMFSTPYESGILNTNDCKLFSEALYWNGVEYEPIKVKNIKNGLGYWIYSYNDCNIQLINFSNPIETPTLSPGVNHIGVPLEGIKKTELNCELKEDPKRWDIESNDWLFVEEMRPGNSYFVNCYPT